MWLRTLAAFCANLRHIRPPSGGRSAPSGEGGKMTTKRMILLAAVSLTALLSNADFGNRVFAQEPGARQQTLSEIYRNSGDIELQNKVAPFKVFDNLYHVGLGYVDAWLISTSEGSS
jgi:hypothetical protein